MNTFRKTLSSAINKWTVPQNFKLNFVELSHYALLMCEMSGNVSCVWKCVIWIYIYVCVWVIFHLQEYRLNVKLPADRRAFVRSPFLVYVPQVRILHQCVPGGKRPHWNTKTTKSTPTCINIIRVIIQGRKKPEYICIAPLGDEQEKDVPMNNKHNKSQVSDNHSNDDNHQPSKQRENKVWTNYMLVNFSPTRHTERIELAVAEQLTMINCPYLRSY